MASSFSGKAGRNAAVWSAQMAEAQRGELNDIYGKGNEQAQSALASGFGPSLDALNQFYGQQRTDAQGGLDQANGTLQNALATGRSDLNQGYGAALDSLGQYYGQGTDALKTAAAGYQPLVDKGLQGYDMYMNALGLNGQAGNDAATGAFQAGPGYQWNVDQATSQAQRSANRLGMAYSGNTVDATTKLASNLANQEYGNWTNRLQGFQGASQNAVAGQAGALGNLATMYGQQGNATAGMQQAQGQNLANLEGQIGSAQATNQLNAGQYLGNAAQNQGQNLAQLQTGYGQSQANLALGNAQNLAGANSTFYQTLIPAGQQGMMAGQQAAANKTGAIMGGVQMGAQLLGGLFGMSDRRLKTDIKEVGKLDNGLPVYSYRFKSGGPMQLGLMADEVKQVHPDAVADVGGYEAVNYGKAVQKWR